MIAPNKNELLAENARLRQEIDELKKPIVIAIKERSFNCLVCFENNQQKYAVGETNIYALGKFIKEHCEDFKIKIKNY